MWRIRNLLKKMNAKKGYLMVIALISIFIVVGYFSYAMFTVNKEQKEAIRIITGTLTGELKVDNVEADRLVVNQGETKEFTVTLRNNNDRTARYLFYYIGTLPEGLEAGYVVEEEMQIPPEDNGRNITVGTTEAYKIRVKNNTTSSQTIQLKLDVGLENIDIEISNNGHLFRKMTRNSAVGTLLTNYTNSENMEFNDNTKDKMFVYHHEETEQQKGWSEEELTDYRYIGANPNNYVLFNNELWRIIGIFTVENEQGEKEQRIKLIRNESLKTSRGNYISWDNKDANEGTSEIDNGSNNWTDSRLMMLLNPGYETNPLASGGKGSLYWNMETGKCPLGKMTVEGSTIVDCDFTNTGLTPETQKMIGTTKWYLGGYNNSGIPANQFYFYERGARTCYSLGICKAERPISWIGEVGLMYASDYGYATSDSSCLSINLYNYDTEICKNNNWIVNRGSSSSESEWVLTPSPGWTYTVLDLAPSGSLHFDNRAYYSGRITRPTVYLNASVFLINGTGSQEVPFVFAI